MMILQLDRKRCVGCGQCSEHMPQYFSQSPTDGRAVARNGERFHELLLVSINQGDEAIAQFAADDCPVSALSVR